MSVPDVIVVGAGPAGATTALLLARAGIRVLLLDRHSFPRAKPCGDCLSAATSDVLRRLGVLERVVAQPHARLEGWRIVAPDGRMFESRFDDDNAAIRDALAIERKLFDATLLEAAIDAGAHFMPRVHVSDLTRDAQGRVNGVASNAGLLHAHCVVGADGLRSITAQRARAVRRPARLRKVSLTARIDAAGLASSFGEMHVGDGVVFGIAAIAACRCNLTVVADADRFGRAIAAAPMAFIRNIADSLPRVAGRVPAAALSNSELLASGPFDRPMRAVTFDGLALVGDAGGYYDPFTGQGIHQALRSAELLSPVLTHALARGDLTEVALRPYARRRARLLRGARAVQQAVELVLSRPRAANASIARLARARRFADTLIAVTGDVRPPARLLSPAALVSLIAP